MSRVIGKNILGNLTTGMYRDSKVIFREYIQNACDQIDLAIKTKLIDNRQKGSIDIYISEQDRSITIRDNATGVPADKFEAQLGDIANSDKTLGENLGFRGIGRLCGLAYCKTLIFKTSYAGENICSEMLFDAKKLRSMLEAKIKYTVDEVLDAVVEIKQTKREKLESHYFEVQLIDINEENRDLLDIAEVKKYLTFVAPVPYGSSFRVKYAIKNYVEENKLQLNEYTITLNGVKILKGYRQDLLDNFGNKYDEITELEFKDIRNPEGDLIAWLWYGLCKFEKAIPKLQNPMYGFRLRQGNIQIGKNDVFADFFKESRGNSYFVGEIFTVSKDLVPNSERNYFNECDTRNILEDQLKDFFVSLHKLYYEANRTKGYYTKIKEFNKKQEEFISKVEKKDFVSAEEKQRLEVELKAAEEKKNEALKAIETIKRNSQDDDNAVAKVQKKIDRAHTSVMETLKKSTSKPTDIPRQQEKKDQYFAAGLSQLNKSERKVVQYILTELQKIAEEAVVTKLMQIVEKKYK